MSKYLSVKYLLLSKKTGALAGAKKLIFGAPFWVPRRVAPKNSGDKIASAAQQIYPKFDFDVLWFRTRTYRI